MSNHFVPIGDDKYVVFEGETPAAAKRKAVAFLTGGAPRRVLLLRETYYVRRSLVRVLVWLGLAEEAGTEVDGYREVA